MASKLSFTTVPALRILAYILRISTAPNGQRERRMYTRNGLKNNGSVKSEPQPRWRERLQDRRLRLDPGLLPEAESGPYLDSQSKGECA
jgi:hypothetical protein